MIGPDVRGGRRGRSSRLIAIAKQSAMNPEQRTAHGNPAKGYVSEIENLLKGLLRQAVILSLTDLGR